MTIEELLDQGSGLVKCYELKSVSIPKNSDVGGRYHISFLPIGDTTYYLLDEIMGNPNYNNTFLIDSSLHPENCAGRCFGLIIETVVSADDDKVESIRLVTAADSTRKGYYLVRFSTRSAFESYQDPASVQWAELKKPDGASADTPADPVDYSDIQIEFALSHLHPPFDGEES